MAGKRKAGAPRAKTAVAMLVREAFARSGRTEPGLLKQALEDARWLRHVDDDVWAARIAIQGTGLRLAKGDGPIGILPSGRDPKVVATLGALDEERRRLRSRIDAINEERASLMRRAVERRLEADGEPVPTEMELGGHDCDGSPTGFCCYDADEDPNLDECLFCGQPDERK